METINYTFECPHPLSNEFCRMFEGYPSIEESYKRLVEYGVDLNSLEITINGRNIKKSKVDF